MPRQPMLWLPAIGPHRIEVTKRRSPGEGSCYFHSASKRWTSTLSLGVDASGKRTSWHGGYHKLKREAVAELQQAIERHRQQEPLTAPKTTLAEFLERWLHDVAEPSTWGRTSAGYRGIVEHHLTPTLGSTRLDRLTPADIQALYASKRATLAASTVLHVHRCLHRALETAVKWRLIARNPCDQADPPRVQRREVTTLSPDQARAFVAALRDDPLEAWWLLWLTTGLREGEMLALRWADVDLEARILSVQRALSRVPHKGWLVKDAKSHQGRSLTLSPLAVDALRRYRVRQAETRLRAGAGWQDRGWLFANSTGNHLHPENLRARSFVPLLARAGIPHIRMYDLRHSAASLLMQLGTSPKVVSEMLGHASVGLTLQTYSHTMPTMQGEAVDRLTEMLRLPGRTENV